MGLKRKKGISLLVPTQNSEKTIAACIRTFADFPDEMIVVDNGSKDKTIEIVKELEREIPRLTFYNAPDLPDLYHNRQYALERSNYNWIVRIDSDYVAYTDGPNDIKKLREKILSTQRGFRPIAYGVTQVNLFRDFYHTGPPVEMGKGIKGRWVPPPINSLPARIIQYYPGMRFQRNGRWEGVRLQRYLKHQKLTEPYWFHCTFKEDMDLFFRSERTNWREKGDYTNYPTLESYIKSIIGEKYETNDMEEACSKFMDKVILPSVVAYDEKKYYPYPELIQQVMESSETFG